MSIFKKRVTRIRAMTCNFILNRNTLLMAACLSLASCAGTGAGRAAAPQVLYPNAVYHRVGDAQAQNDVVAALTAFTVVLSSDV